MAQNQPEALGKLRKIILHEDEKRVTEGVVPEKISHALWRCEQKIHNLRYKELRAFDGNADAFVECDKVFKKYLIDVFSETDMPAAEEKTTTGKAWIFLLLLFAALTAVSIWKWGLPFTFAPKPQIEAFDHAAELARIRNEQEGVD